MTTTERKHRVLATVETLPTVLKQLREAQGLSQRDVARRAGTTASVVCRLENPSYRSYSLDTLCRIGAALGVEVAVEFHPVDHPEASAER